jgi:hypothetical protein
MDAGRVRVVLGDEHGELLAGRAGMGAGDAGNVDAGTGQASTLGVGADSTGGRMTPAWAWEWA